jgi:hypothetical protein
MNDDAQKFVAARIRADRELGRSGDNSENSVIARGILNEELGTYGREFKNPYPYRLDEDTRDNLLAHARQDAAHVLLNSASLLKRVRRLQLLGYVLLAAITALFVLVLVRT